ncbi:MAG TPA: sugar ABC transporter substrate-binding protein [bacterium]|nr:sugar ABC transporter substrate-binding protein [bacterium]
MKKTWGAALVIIFALTSCSKQQAPEQASEKRPEAAPAKVSEQAPRVPSNYVIGVSYQNLAFPYVAALQQAAENEAKRLGVKLVETDAMNDTGKELENVERMLGQKVDCLAFEAASLDASVASLEAANRAGVPVVQFNGKANGGRYVTFVGSNQIESGDLLGQWLAEFYKKSGRDRLRGIYLRGVAGQVTDIARNDGFKQRLEKEGLAARIELTEQFADYDRGKGQSVTESILSRDKDYDFIIANNDDMVLGARQAVDQFGLAGKIALVGVDGLPETLAAIKSGRITATVFQNPEGQGAGGIEACVKHLRAETLPQEILIPFELVTPENVDKFIAIAERVYVK